MTGKITKARRIVSRIATTNIIKARLDLGSRISFTERFDGNKNGIQEWSIYHDQATTNRKMHDKVGLFCCHKLWISKSNF